MENYKKELEQLKKELNDRIDVVINKINTPKFEVGKCYSDIDTSQVIGFYKENGDCNYGFRYNIWHNNIVMNNPKNWRLSTKSEATEALTKEAIKRGLVTGNYALFGTKRVKRLITSTNYYLNKNGFFIGNDHLMTNDGVWAELYKPKSIDELASEFDILHIDNFFTSHSSLFKNFITENKSEIIEALKNLPE